MPSLKNAYQLVLTFILFPLTGWSINSNAKVAQALNNIFKDDQKFRSIDDFSDETITLMKFRDKLNLIKVKSIIRKHNWPFDNFG